MLRKLHLYNKAFVAVLVILAYSSLSSLSASAASDYGIVMANTLMIGGTENDTTCDQANMSVEWGSIRSTDTNNQWSYKNTWSYTQNSGNTARVKLDGFFEEFNQKVSNGDTTGWAVTQSPLFEADDANQMVRIWLFDSDTHFTITQGVVHADKSLKFVDFFLNPGSGCRYQAWQYQVATTANIWMNTNRIFFLATEHVTYPIDYAGEPIPVSNAWADLDGDGLIAAEETAQGTSNFIKDTDGDGLNDYIESQWFPNRDDVFCGSLCAYPNPIAKDMYVEIDWMKDSSNRTFKPNATQLNTIKDAFDDKGITAHFDTGQYGGGNQLLTYVQNLPFANSSSHFDFYDYKNGTSTSPANFNTNRQGIWHYLLSGYQYQESPGSSGASYAGDDDTFIATGLIEDGQQDFGYLSLDTAMAGTIIHELGHNLCLSSEEAYVSQPVDCIYEGVDNPNASSSYESSMNYSYQMFMVDYSDGSNGSPNDHDDWTAVAAGMKDFAGSTSGDVNLLEGTKQKNKNPKVQGISITQAKELQKKNKLGKNNMNYFTRHHK